MTADTDTTPGAATSRSDATAGPLRKRALADREIIQRRAEGELLKSLAAAAGIGVPTLSEWFRRPDIAKKLADAKLDIKVTKQLADRERREQERKAKAEKRRAREAAKPPEPEPEWDRSTETWDAYVERQARAGHSGKILLRSGPIQW